MTGYVILIRSQGV